jgi:hypothetical protein
MASSLKRWLFPLVFTIILVCYTLLTSETLDLYSISNAFVYPGMLLLAYVLLRLITRTGVYDVTGYGLSRFRDSIFRAGKNNYEDVHAYKDVYELKRKQQPFIYLPSLIIGLINVGLSILFAFLAVH